MPKINSISASYSGESGAFITKDNAVHVISRDSNPYQYLLGALSGCFYYTLRDVAHNMELSYDRVAIEVSCTKREVLPTTMDKCQMEITAYDVEDQEGFVMALEKTCQCCSIYYTLSQVAEISYSVEFV